MNKHSILCVDDEQNILNSLRRLFRKEGYTILTALSGKDGLEILRRNPVDLMISDQRMPGMTGVELLKEARKISQRTIRIILSGYTDVDSITSAVNEGNVYKFILKPWNDEELKLSVKRALEQHDLEMENQRLHEQVKRRNEELLFLNKDLERRVRDRTEDLVFQNQALLFSQKRLENLPIGIVGIGEDRTIAYVNKKAEEIYGNDVKSFLTLDIAKFFPDKIVSPIKDALETDNPGSLHNFLYKGRVLNIDCVPIDNTSPGKGVVLVAVEVTDDR